MGWTERQRRMLAEMGLPPWLAPAAVPNSGLDAPEVPVEPPVVEGLAPLPSPPAPVPVPVSVPAVPLSSAAPLHPSMGELDWVPLRAAVQACTACALSTSRTQTVFGVGHPQADWMIVGEAPGEQEDRLGEPFVGRSGQLLDNMLSALGLARTDGPPERQVYIANTLKCRPPGNRNPTPEELAKCEPFLVRQIALVRPKIILAMGRFAVQSLLRSSDPIGRLRGHVHRYQGVPLIVTYHPAYLLRNPEEKARAWDDLCLALETCRSASHPT